MLHASRQWLGEVSQSSEAPPNAFPQIPYSAMYVGETIPDGMRDYESEEDNPMDEDTPMQVQIRCFTILRRIGFVTFTSWKRLQLHYPKWLWKHAHIWSPRFTPLRVEWRGCMPPCSNPLPRVLKRVSGSSKFIRSAIPSEQISKILLPEFSHSVRCETPLHKLRVKPKR